MQSWTYVAAVTALLLGSCSGTRFYGPQTFIDGVPEAYVRCYVDLQEDWHPGDAPTVVGLEMSSAFMENRDKLPVIDTYMADINFTVKAWTHWVDIPRQDAQPYKRVLFVWEATGHPPLEVYGKAHFDVHFTMNPKDDWNAMFDFTENTTGPCAGLSPEGFSNMFEPIPAQCFPAGTHVQLGDVKYGHASHLVPTKFAPEWNPPQLFNHTLIYGEWGGDLQFIEPMVSFQYLNSEEVRKKAQWFPTGSPDAWKNAKFYPDEYGYYWNKDESIVSIELGSFLKAKPCVYHPDLGYEGWFPAEKALPGPEGVCIAPTPENWVEVNYDVQTTPAQSPGTIKNPTTNSPTPVATPTESSSSSDEHLGKQFGIGIGVGVALGLGFGIGLGFGLSKLKGCWPRKAPAAIPDLQKALPIEV